MQKRFTLLFLVFLVFTQTKKLMSQDIKLISSEEYDKQKSSRLLKENTLYIHKDEFKEVENIPSSDKLPSSNRTTNTDCQCMIPLDNTFTVAQFVGFGLSASNQYRNDDASTGAKLLPFDFCFYGTNYNAVYINNNGNISFGTGYSTFSASGFPSAQYKMIAPFWADVDTRNVASGVVHYKITDSYMIVKWENVGYYNSYADKKNTFQLIISNGNDTLIPGDNNVAFCYGDMQWTTGDASQGNNGFGGVPATVGANSGNGTSFFQIGRFDVAGTNFVQTATNGNGVSYLDDKTYYFNTCGASTNVAPIASSASYSCRVDTLQLCSASDSLLIPVSFTAPENNQTLTVTATCNTLGSALSTLTNTNGNAVFLVSASAALSGTHIISITATDNGVPSLSTTLEYLIEIPDVVLPNPVLSVSPTGPICGNVGATVSLNNCTDYTSIQWADGSNGCSVVLNQTGQTSVTVVAANGCTKTSFQQVTINPSPIIQITGDTNFCNNNSVVLTANISGTTAPVISYSWSSGATIQNATISSPGQVNVTVTDANGCIGYDSITVTNITPTITINPSNTEFCPTVPVTLSASTPGASYAWSSNPPGSYPDAQVISVNPTVNTTYTVQATQNGCVFSNTVSLIALIQPIVSLYNDSVCVGQQTTIRAVVTPPGSYQIVWQPGGLTGSVINSVPGTTYTVSATVGGSCPSNTPQILAIDAFPGPKPSIVSQTLENPLAPDTILCFKENKLLTASMLNGVAPFNYLWSPASGTTATNDSLKVLVAGTYYLTITDANGCIGKDTIEIDLFQPTINLSGTPFICPLDTGFIKVNASTNLTSYGNTYIINWLPAGLGNNDTVFTSTPGQYVATFVDTIYGCTASANFNVNYYAIPTANFTAAPEPSDYNSPVYFNSTSTIAVGSITQCYWYYGDGDSAFSAPVQTHIYDAPGNYPVILIVRSNRGCLDTVIINHEVIATIPLVNIITPNTDNINNTLHFNGLQFYPNSKIRIFNRWGNLIYTSDDYKNDWNGEEYEAGTYYYILEVPNLKPQENILTNFFQIIR
jgi:gliding motility-associated-like protein